MPQLDLITYPSQLFWLGVTFALLYYVMARFIVPRIEQLLGTRAAHIDRHLQQADALQKRAEELQQKQERLLQEAQDKAQQRLQEQDAAWSAREEEQKQRRQKELAQAIESAQKTIAASHQDALKQLESASVPLLKAMVARSSHIDLSDSQLQKAVRESVSQWR